VGECKSEQRAESEAGSLRAAYRFLFEKLEKDGVRLIASEADADLEVIGEMIAREKMEIGVERYGKIEEHPSLCYYSKSTGEMVVGVASVGGNKYYVSYYLGAEGRASKEIQIKRRRMKWAAVPDDELWEVK
jgi:hypothetical protein